MKMKYGISHRHVSKVLIGLCVLCGLSLFFGIKTGFADNIDNLSILKVELSGLNLKDPSADMEINFSKGDKRFVSVCGYACWCPGVDKNDASYVQQYDGRRIEGTSDAIESEEHGKLIQIARQYAEKYNVALIMKLKQVPTQSPIRSK